MFSLVVLTILLAFCSAQVAPLYGPGEYEILPGQYLVKVRTDVPLHKVALHGSRVINEYHIGGFQCLLVHADEPQLTQLRQDPQVEFVVADGKGIHAAVEENSLYLDEPIYREPATQLHGILGETHRTVTKNICNSQSTTDYVWGLTRTSSVAMPNYGSGSYHYSTYGDNVDAYVIDSGVYIQHNTFQGRATHGFTASIVSSEGDEDLNGHGTHVAGTIAGAEFGIAKAALVIAVKVLAANNQGYISDFIEGLEWAVQHHHDKASSGRKSIVNMSLGAFGNNPALDNAVASAVLQGVPVAVAAMNDNRDACLGSPSKVATAFTVGATNVQDDISSFSNYGTCVNLLAPGQSVRSSFIGNPSATAVYSGTSMATPHVAGVVAQYLSEGVNLTPAQIMNRLIDTSSKNYIYIPPSKQTTPNRLLYNTCA